MTREGSASQLPRLIPRLLVAASGLALALHLALPDDGSSLRSGVQEAWRRDGTLALLCFGFAWAVLGLSFGAAALRFQILLAGAGVASRWRVLLRAYVVAGFFNLVLPGGMLGDVYRFLDARRDVGRGALVLGLVLLERLLGLSALGALGLMAFPLLPIATEHSHWTAGLVLALVSCLLLPLAPLHPRINGWLRSALAPLSSTPWRVARRLGDGAQRSLAAISTTAERPVVLVRAYALSLLSQWLPVAAVFALSLPFESDVAWYWFALIVPFVTLVSLLPISIGGTGVRELLFIALFGALGMKSEVALTLSLSILAVALVWALIGFGVFSLGRRAQPDGGLVDATNGATGGIDDGSRSGVRDGVRNGTSAPMSEGATRAPKATPERGSAS